MSAESEPIEQIVDQYPHRTQESVETDLDSKAILSRYLDHQGVNEYDFIESDHPFYAALGRVKDSEGQLVLTSHYTYPDDTDFSQDHTRASLTVEKIDAALEENVIDENSILEASGAEIIDSKKASTLNEDELRPETVHCVVFYDRPVVSAIEDTEYESTVHKQAAMQSLSEPSLATAIIHSGRNSSGDDFAAAQIDYWTRTMDGINGGLDYTELNWENPGF
ncbi:hypothetical protein ACK3SF_03770 [Candidatus Nanosalina sp. VS9-1]|uniref:hypothetical protein n=1 Tax=Candidatus Nanosalina sp. VS9-1 TaxID=3388566 RepID=UPI0039E0A25B